MFINSEAGKRHEFPFHPFPHSRFPLLILIGHVQQFDAISQSSGTRRGVGAYASITAALSQYPPSKVLVFHVQRYFTFALI